jgi:hypothetical protein
MSRRSLPESALPLLVLLAIFGLLVVPLTAGGDTHGDGETVFTVELDASGDAHWQITQRIPLADESEETAFALVADEFESGEYDLDAPGEIRSAAGAVDGSTDRPMSVTAINRTSSIGGEGENRTGTLTVSFTWENFARTSDEGDDLHIDDVLTTARGLWLPGLTADQTLVVRAPEGYAVLDASVPPQNGTLQWRGPADFDQEMLTATFAGNGNGTVDNSDDDNSTSDTGDADDDSDDSNTGLLWVVLGGAGIAAVAAVLTLYRARLRGLLDREPASEPDRSTTDGGAQTETGQTDAVSPADGPESPTVQTPAEETTDTESDDDGIDVELLSDEERVERLLERNGGRMKQADIVDETGWSNAKVSQLLSAMAEDDRIDKLRIGRENLISFPDVDVTDSDGDA